MSEELKPCPFCGGTDIAISVDENQGNKWGSAVCYSCSAVGPEVRTGYETYPEASWRAEAAAEWNRRASPTPHTTEGREAWRIGMLNAAAICEWFSDAKNAAREIRTLAAMDGVADNNLRSARSLTDAGKDKP